MLVMTYIMKCPLALILALVVQKLDSAIHRMNCFPADKSYGNKVIYPVDRFIHSPFEQLRPERLHFCQTWSDLEITNSRDNQ